MLLAREFVDFVSRQIVKKLTPQWIETTDNQVAAEFIATVVEEDLSIEDRLNDEVRELLSQYSDYMRREGVSYQEMFRRIKNTLVSQRKIVRAAGRDTGDAMKLSRDKVSVTKGATVPVRLSRGPGKRCCKIPSNIMQTKIPVGILGATGTVGQRFVQLLESHPWFEAKWLGACKPDQKPGDIVMPGGFKMNVRDMDKLKALLPK